MAGVSKRQPRFLWQGVLILMPVAVMAAIGTVAVLRDRAAVEQQARERAREMAQQLAAILSQRLSDELAAFDAAADICMDYHRRGGDSGKGHDAVGDWQAEHPDINLTESAPNRLVFSREGSLLWPGEYDAAPGPPAWFVELSSEQRRLWEAIQRAPSAREQEEDIADFLATEPSREARANLEFRLGRGSDAFPEADRQIMSESGIPLGNLAFARLGREIWNDPELEERLDLLLDAPSVLIPEMLRRAEAVEDPEAGGSVNRVKRLWAAQERLRRIASDLRKRVDLKIFRETNLWLDAEGERYMCVFRPWVAGEETFRDVGGFGAEGVSLKEARLYPVGLVRRAVEDGAGAGPMEVPGYFQVRAGMMGEALYVGPVEERGVAGEVLATADARGAGTGAVTEAPGSGKQAEVTVQIALVDRPLLFRQQRQRTALFGALIGASVVAAVIGFLAAYRSFRRQLRLSELKSNFVSSVSHELRAPIASVRLMAESLERGKITGGPKQQEYFRFISQECRRLSSLIENVLDFSRIDQGRKHYEFEPTDMGALVEHTVRLMEPYAGERGIFMGVRMSGAVSTTIQAVVDGKAMQQALINLVDNAIKFSPKGQEVTVGLEMPANPPGTIRLWVEDRGVGIPSNEQERIFEQFYRLGSELRRESQGVGIGLSIVKHIVEAHGGRVEVWSAPGEGSRFTMELPAQRV